MASSALVVPPAAEAAVRAAGDRRAAEAAEAAAAPVAGTAAVEARAAPRAAGVVVHVAAEGAAEAAGREEEAVEAAADGRNRRGWKLTRQKPPKLAFFVLSKAV